MAVAVVCATSLWLILIEAELTWRFGILDMPGSLPHEDRRERLCCERPPCGDGDFTRYLLSNCGPKVAVLVMDFHLTRGFADQVLEEKDAMLHAAMVTEQVASSLASYDLDAAESHLSDHVDKLRPDLITPLRRILENLRGYRPYLPHELLKARRAPRGGASGRPPLHPRSVRAVVMMSVPDAAALWAQSSTGMQDALSTYHQIIRTAYSKEEGDGVKTFEDSCLLVFNELASAMNFAFEVQEACASSVWPEDLGREGCPARMRVQIGVDYGEVSLERSTLTGEVEYFGPTVQRAGIIGRRGVAGTVVVTQTALDALPAGMRDELEAVQLAALDEHGGVSACAVLPRRTHVASVPGSIASSSEKADDTASANISITMSSSPRNDADSPPLWARTLQTSATIGMLQYSLPCDMEALQDWEASEEKLTARLEVLHGHLTVTGGFVSTVLNDLVLVSWGIHGACTQHVNESVRCMLRLNEEWGGGDGKASFHAGLVTGAVACGTVAPSPMQRYVTVMGPCVDAALMLCAGAAEVETAVLCTNMSGNEMHGGNHFLEGNYFFSEHLWPVDTWVLRGEHAHEHDKAAVTVYEICLRSAAAALAPTNAAAPRRSYADRLARGAHLSHALAVTHRLPGQRPHSASTTVISSGCHAMTEPADEGVMSALDDGEAIFRTW
eukprot:TRINITY_DN11889_c0_g4_i1.p1 TRINITY_DN11889_c0_g4~~TRINITY_DN11889_c0_g4_i1.p1  ORF type:complete len:692 (+),score=151.00 TRINITY_DN11889_c0_g4_i1:64-2076(+)